MEEERARTIIAALANGVDPTTGEPLGGESIYQAPDVVRALMCAVRSLESRHARRERSDLPSNAGKPWSGEEDERLAAEFDAGRTLKEIAERHARTIAGIEARLEKLGRLDPESRTTPRRYPIRSDGSQDRTRSGPRAGGSQRRDYGD